MICWAFLRTTELRNPLMISTVGWRFPPSLSSSLAPILARPSRRLAHFARATRWTCAAVFGARRVRSCAIWLVDFETTLGFAPRTGGCVRPALRAGKRPDSAICWRRAPARPAKIVCFERILLSAEKEIFPHGRVLTEFCGIFFCLKCIQANGIIFAFNKFNFV